MKQSDVPWLFLFCPRQILVVSFVLFPSAVYTMFTM